MNVYFHDHGAQKKEGVKLYPPPLYPYYFDMLYKHKPHLKSLRKTIDTQKSTYQTMST